MDLSKQPGPLVTLVDDDPDLRALISRWLTDVGMRVIECPSTESFLESLDVSLPDIVCLDLGLPGMSGRQALGILRRKHPGVPVLMVTAEASAEAVVEAMQSGASDYLTKPVDRDKLLAAIQRALRSPQARSPVQIDQPVAEVSYAGVIGRSARMREVFRQIDRVAARDISVVIHGESGTGKELIARAIHENSRRAGGPFVAINCAAIPESLQDSELFGHERGSFTGAHKARPGCFERADGGTLFLDEVAELSLGVQAKLLRVLQERSFERLGGVRNLRSDFRLITATHSRLRDMVAANRFREDLYFRIAVFEMELPPLRKREGDLRLLVPRLLEELSDRAGGGSLCLSAEAMDALEAYAFPGNVRELENILQCAAVLTTGQQIGLNDLPARVRDSAPPTQRTPSSGLSPVEQDARRARFDEGADAQKKLSESSEQDRGSSKEVRAVEDLPLNLVDLERWAVKRALRNKGGRLTETAKALGIGRTTLYRKLEKYGLR